MSAAFDAMASPLFCHGLLNDFGFKTLLSIHFFAAKT
ncbi:hypothetical protein SARI_03813 [Salmonella enterica subsp. arizonae serovar 62:z4,z23:-]|uniref:Uncharacterized protein n=1 Tax=Salmonella arizonae (strain ATCC BAA-731 / CDC346-86 / RSK2980) TaxID=41514 RepID=A9MJU6_SALAR|nr:hypothetical protein SARI_03813 [Salmonella enterica subsp. arizonae serovar 62:z4,z23:-]